MVRSTHIHANHKNKIALHWGKKSLINKYIKFQPTNRAYSAVATTDDKQALR